MAKSLRSKFKRAMRATARIKKQVKSDALLQKVIEKREIYEKMEAEKAAASTSNDADAMEVNGPPATINVKTMKKADGTFPSWLNGKKKKKALSKLKSKKGKGRKHGF
ncbi:unnamed protein product [Caenorhabditis bovis]|uniref:Uncharacterized protein n=1 Tax=Caenorhabditis bovis TaxID=2654633 RepID=A0A8S1FDJ1_9PELO|nr:unnamed protein product [Caenorhabditis bovis]